MQRYGDKKIRLCDKNSIPLQYNDYIFCTRDKRVTEINWNLKYAIFSTACSIVYKFCTRPISKHLYSGIVKDPLGTKHKIFKCKIFMIFYVKYLDCVSVTNSVYFTFPTLPTTICNLLQKINLYIKDHGRELCKNSSKLSKLSCCSRLIYSEWKNVL